MQNGALSDYAEADNTRNTGPNHSNIASVLGMSVSTVAVICHTPVTAYVTGSNLVVQDVKKPLPGRIPSAIHSHT